MARRKRKLAWVGSALNASIIGIQFPIAMAIGYLCGWWLDKHLGTGPWLTIVFTLCGVAAGFYNLFVITANIERAEKEESGDERGSKGERSDRGGEPG
jgi:ATP synthase protein I